MEHVCQNSATTVAALTTFLVPVDNIKKYKRLHFMYVHMCIYVKM